MWNYISIIFFPLHMTSFYSERFKNLPFTLALWNFTPIFLGVELFVIHGALHSLLVLLIWRHLYVNFWNLSFSNYSIGSYLFFLCLLLVKCLCLVSVLYVSHIFIYLFFVLVFFSVAIKLLKTYIPIENWNLYIFTDIFMQKTNCLLFSNLLIFQGISDLICRGDISSSFWQHWVILQITFIVFLISVRVFFFP